jgi:hypothetical protein
MASSRTCPGMQGRDGKVVHVYRKRWVIHIERLAREKVNGTSYRMGLCSSVGSRGIIPLCWKQHIMQNLLSNEV